MAELKKVVLIGSAHPLRGGLATFNERLVREYLAQGDDAYISTFTLQYPSILFPGKTQLSTEPAPAGLPITIEVNSINPLNWIRVGLRIKKTRPDLVIVKFWLPFMAPCFGTICRIIKRNRHTRIISIVDNLIPHEKRPGDKLLIWYWVNCVDGFIAMSRSVEKDIQDFTRRAPKPTKFSPHPLYDNFGDPVPKQMAMQRLNLDPYFSYVLFFGFIRDYKGLDLLLEAFSQEQLKNQKVRLLVAGEFYCDPQPYLEIITKHSLQDKVILSNDFIPDSQVVNYFCAADLVVQPYKSATQSGVTQIAYHFNKPMIITDVGGLAEFVPDGKVGFVVQPDPVEIAAAILRFYDEGREAEFSAAAAIEKKKYSWSTMTTAINNLVNS
jgi:D-inositol-3-phosphate glycosyltransferase